MQLKRQPGRMNIHQQLVREVALRILSGDIAPGETLSTEDMASAELEVSRTAYREAVKVLSAKGFLESRPRVGTRVRGRAHWNILDPDVIAWKAETESTSAFVEQLFDFRRIIEPEAAFLSARNSTPHQVLQIRAAVLRMAETRPETAENFEADIAFHSGILRASGNEFLGSLGHVVEVVLLKSFQLSSHRPGAREDSVPLHMNVVQQIQNGRGEQARKAMMVLLDSARADLDEVLARQEEEIDGALERNLPLRRTDGEGQVWGQFRQRRR